MNYYKTILYYNVFDTTNYVVLNSTAKCIDYEEMEQGYVSKRSVEMRFRHLTINMDAIGENTYMIEYMTTAPDSLEKVETLRVKVIDIYESASDNIEVLSNALGDFNEATNVTCYSTENNTMPKEFERFYDYKPDINFVYDYQLCKMVLDGSSITTYMFGAHAKIDFLVNNTTNTSVIRIKSVIRITITTDNIHFIYFFDPVKQKFMYEYIDYLDAVRAHLKINNDYQAIMSVKN